ncbi:hypothetical protein Solca_1591 [Solitalea canadensis DSM 3403]|uniref:Uncharacterized protein n=1 Tax=Solitalea canadensis (strain ATCC 29591 / DSM 3403 / JCM 21819 / LMG 8368 / NBRC 15130 / NCIMB 12057 / USAM 9D) TaxID=929556 RepID=H8KTT4_SOLCM|nr:hypothetical protein Solca_1591 [Solitalea canadensis DSM 3403]
MKDFLKFIVVNLFLFVTSYICFMITVFLMGYASNEKHTVGIWVLFFIFLLLNIIAYSLVLYNAKKITSKTFFYGVSVITFAWIFAAIMAYN